MKNLLLACLVSVFLLGSCATPAPANLSYSASSPNAFIILVAPHSSGTSQHIYRQVNLETKAFETQLAKFTIGGMGGTPVIKNSSSDGLSLVVKEVPAGTYALVENSRPIFTGAATGSAWNCYSDLVPVYKANAGEITVLVAEDPNVKILVARKGDQLPQYIEDARAAYPDLKGDIVISEPDAWITWPRKKGNLMETMNRNCAEPDTFELAPLMTPAQG